MHILAQLLMAVLAAGQRDAGPRAEIKLKDRDIEGALADFTRRSRPTRAARPPTSAAARSAPTRASIDQAIADYSKAVESDPKFAKAWFGRGMVKTYNNDADGALADFTKAVEADPTYTARLVQPRAPAAQPQGLRRRRRRLHEGDRPQAAGRDMYVGRGNAYASKGDHEKAIADYAKAIEIKPNSSSAYVYKGDCEMKKGDAIGAMLTFSKAIEVNPKDAEAYYFRGYANYDRRAFKEAGEDFKKAYDLNRLSEFRTDQLQLRLWLIKARAGQAADASKELKLYATKEHRGRPGDWFNQIVSFLTGDLPEDQFLNLAGNKVQTCDTHFYAGVKKVIAKDKKAAKDHFKKAIDSGATDSAEYWSAMAEIEGVDKEK
jgi:tetratricopeptide (TPR) repeat protein